MLSHYKWLLFIIAFHRFVILWAFESNVGYLRWNIITLLFVLQVFQWLRSSGYYCFTYRCPRVWRVMGGLEQVWSLTQIHSVSYFGGLINSLMVQIPFSSNPVTPFFRFLTSERLFELTHSALQESYTSLPDQERNRDTVRCCVTLFKETIIYENKQNEIFVGKPPLIIPTWHWSSWGKCQKNQAGDCERSRKRECKSVDDITDYPNCDNLWAVFCYLKH